ncbi:unnamed protein product [Ranitomeya imitator]|uniref:Uncharacterized protein n=1 Tax=Ranitomeya imitator TaxID=111125 RepID=A0ABN9LNN1_9NEOB|nr:unnamed protein product [Ranitomeya imitator]
MYRALPSRSINSSTRGIGYASNLETAFSFLKSLQNRMEPSGLGINTIGLDQALCDSSMTPKSNIAITSRETASRRASGIRDTGTCIPESGLFGFMISVTAILGYISVIKMHFVTNLPAGRFGGRTAHAPTILQDGGAQGEDGRTDNGTGCCYNVHKV